MRKLITIMMVMIILFVSIPYTYADDEDEELVSEEYVILNEINDTIETSKTNNSEPIVNSRKCVIYDRDSKRVIYGKNENAKCAMASTTKIMTAIVVLENAELNKQVIIDSKSAGTGGSRLGLKKNDKISINDLLYGLMLKSGNDAAVALAIDVGGNLEGFANLMNQKAEELKLKNTHFVTPHGLDDPEHYTTAEELAIITDYALENEIFKKIVGTKSYTITVNGIPRTINNTNELLGVLDGVVGVKTGFTNGAGRCLVTEVKRGDRDLITIVLGADTKKDRTKDSIKLINFAFNNFKEFNLEENINQAFEDWKNINEKRIEVNKARDDLLLSISKINTKELLLQEKDINKIEYEFNTITYLEAPIEKNKKIGTIVITLDGKIIEQVDIINKNQIERKTFIDYLLNNCEMVHFAIIKKPF